MNKEKLLKKGGKASGKSRRKKRFIKEQLEQLMLLDLPEGKLKETIRSFGIKEDNMTIQSGILCALVQQALRSET